MNLAEAIKDLGTSIGAVAEVLVTKKLTTVEELTKLKAKHLAFLDQEVHGLFNDLFGGG